MREDGEEGKCERERERARADKRGRTKARERARITGGGGGGHSLIDKCVYCSSSTGARQHTLGSCRR